MKIPERVYHYTKRETTLERILPERTIQLGSLGRTNDPRETKEWGFSVMNPPNINTTDINLFVAEMNELQNVANHIRLNEWWVLSSSRDDVDLIPAKINQPDFTHFKYGYARSRMWAQYAQNHAGICLELDGPAIHEAIQETAQHGDIVFFGDIQYSDEWDVAGKIQRLQAGEISYPDIHKMGIKDGLRHHIRSHHKSFFLEKSLDWKCETEFRWLVNSNSRQEPIRVDIGKALTSVIVGVDFPHVYGPCLRALCSALGVKLERMFWTGRVPTRQPWEVM